MAVNAGGWSPETRQLWDLLTVSPEGLTAVSAAGALGWDRDKSYARLQNLYAQRFAHRVPGLRKYVDPITFYVDPLHPPLPVATTTHQRASRHPWTGPIVNAAAPPVSVSRRAGDGLRDSDALSTEPAAPAPDTRPRPLKCWIPSCKNWKWGETNYCYDHAALAPLPVVELPESKPESKTLNLPPPIPVRRERAPKPEAKLLGAIWTCKIDGCEEPEVSTQGYCEPHRRRYGPIAW